VQEGGEGTVPLGQKIPADDQTLEEGEGETLPPLVQKLWAVEGPNFKGGGEVAVIPPNQNMWAVGGPNFEGWRGGSSFPSRTGNFS
jgi:hypothetical protein